MCVNDKVEDADGGFKLGELQPTIYHDVKYGCGDMKLTNPPNNLWDEDEDCDLDYGKMDRGWYKRVYNYCKNIDKDDRLYPDVCDLNGYKVVLSYAIACGVGWILCGIFAFIAARKPTKKFSYITAIAFLVFYLAFLGFFASAWNCRGKFNKKCLNHACNDVKKRGKKSSFEFLAYSAVSFVLILISVIFSFVSACGLSSSVFEAKEEKVHAGSEQEPRSPVRDSDAKQRVERE